MTKLPISNTVWRRTGEQEILPCCSLFLKCLGRTDSERNFPFSTGRTRRSVGSRRRERTTGLGLEEVRRFLLTTPKKRRLYRAAFRHVSKTDPPSLWFPLLIKTLTADTIWRRKDRININYPPLGDRLTFLFNYAPTTECPAGMIPFLGGYFCCKEGSKETGCETGNVRIRSLILRAPSPVKVLFSAKNSTS